MVGGVDISVASESDKVAAFVNGHLLVRSPSMEESKKGLMPTIAAIASGIHRAQLLSDKPLIVYQSDWLRGKDVLSDLARYLQQSLGPRFALRKNRPGGCPAPELWKSPVEDVSNEQLVSNLAEYSNTLSEVSRNIDRSIDRSKVLCKRKLIPGMWGAQKTQEALDSVSESLGGLEEESFNASRRANLTRKSINRLMHRMENGRIDPDDRSYVREILIPEILGNHNSVLDSTSKIVSGLTPLENIDVVFQENIGNPASWFLPSNVMEDLSENYWELVKFLTSLPRFENGVMIPLECLKLQES